ncbi:uncharacterized protein LOC120214272 [Hibiscus syriacus]|uniref:uncharacterized protein LOC120214272 n=1 Tax=Hibiscus syriacus TaxID=106335 RepID=UPI0019209B16|nr:uncharacterized protein LOC120214272 [Hibiscus syriacus]
MSEDDWVKQALTDSTLAARALLSLFQSESPPPRSGSATSQALQIEWSVRQRRSKQSLKNKAEPTRASPNTPLSWSGGVSVSGSGSGDGSEESSRPPLKPVENARSKVATTKEITPPKRSRRKKTLAELKEEISSHLKENKSLKNELEIVKLKFENIRTENKTLSRKLEFEKDRATEESSKRTKFDYHPAMEMTIEPNDAISEARLEREVACHTCIGCCEGQDMAMASCNETSFELPDLNLPVEDGLGCWSLLMENR